MRSPALWGTEAQLKDYFAGHKIEVSRKVFNFRCRSAPHWLDVFKTYYGPTNRAFAALAADKQAALDTDLLALLDRVNRGGDSTLIVPSEYLEVVVTKR